VTPLLTAWILVIALLEKLLSPLKSKENYAYSLFESFFHSLREP